MKAIRCHYYRHNREAVITEELSSDEDDVESEDEQFENEEAESDNDFVFADLDEKSSPALLSFCGGWERRGDHETFHYRQGGIFKNYFTGGSGKCYDIATKTLRTPSGDK